MQSPPLAVAGEAVLERLCRDPVYRLEVPSLHLRLPFLAILRKQPVRRVETEERQCLVALSPQCRATGSSHRSGCDNTSRTAGARAAEHAAASTNVPSIAA